MYILTWKIKKNFCFIGSGLFLDFSTLWICKIVHLDKCPHGHGCDEVKTRMGFLLQGARLKAWTTKCPIWEYVSIGWELFIWTVKALHKYQRKDSIFFIPMQNLTTPTGTMYVPACVHIAHFTHIPTYISCNCCTLQGVNIKTVGVGCKPVQQQGVYYYYT